MDEARIKELLELLKGPMDTQLEEEVRTILFGDWVTRREDARQRGSDLVCFPDGGLEAWEDSLGKVQEAFCKHPDLSSEGIDYLIEQATLDQGYHFDDGVSGGWQIHQGSLHALLGRDPAVQLTPDQTKSLVRLSTFGGYVSFIFGSVQRQAWFHWDESVPLTLYTQTRDGREHLEKFRSKCDTETWDALVGTWRGTVAELIEACTLTQR